MDMLNCSRCEGFIPAKTLRCPHCDQTLHCDQTIHTGRSTLRKLLNVAGGGAVAVTLMACYGGGPMRAPQPPVDQVNAPTCSDPSKDVDGDNYCENDCDEVNKDIHPGALDPEGDGIDQNCDGADGIKTDQVAQ
jgi:hypothetical protein